MAINPLSAAGPAGVSGAGSAPRTESFGKVLKGTAQTSQAAPQPLPHAAAAQANEAKAVSQAQAGKTRVGAATPSTRAEPLTHSKEAQAARVLDQVSQAQSKMDQILKLAESGKAFSPAELLSLQAHMYRASQELDLAGKVVEKSTGGVKQILQTQV